MVSVAQYRGLAGDACTPLQACNVSYVTERTHVGRNLRVGVCCGGIHLLRPPDSQGKEGLCHWSKWFRRRARERRDPVSRRNSACVLRKVHSKQTLLFGCQDPADNTLEPFDLGTFTRDPDVAAVVCGLDMKINYTKLSKAFQYLTQNEDCHFIATNEDSTYPSHAGLLPGAGSISAPLRYALGRDPVCTGKPASTMLDCVKAKYIFLTLAFPLRS